MKKFILLTTLCLLLLVPEESEAAIASVTTASWQETGATTYTESFNNTGAATDLLIVGVALWSDTVDTITYNGENLTQRMARNQSGYHDLEIWTLGDGSIATGANNLVIGTFAANRNMTWGATILSGAVGDSFNAGGSDGASGGSYSGQNMTMTTLVDNSWHVSLHANGGLRTHSSVDSTELYDQANTTNGGQSAMYYQLKATAGSVTNTVVFSGAPTDERAGVSMEVKVAAAAAPAVKKQSEIFF